MVTATATRARASVKIANQVADALCPQPLGKIIDKMFDLREKKRSLDAEAAKVEAEYKEQEELLMERMTKEDTDKAAGKKASVSISTGIVANVTDWQAVEAFVKKTGNFQLYQRRISDAAYRELMETSGKKGVPGMEPFTKRRINLRVAA